MLHTVARTVDVDWDVGNIVLRVGVLHGVGKFNHDTQSLPRVVRLKPIQVVLGILSTPVDLFHDAL